MRLINPKSINKLNDKIDDAMLDAYIARVANNDKAALTEIYRMTSSSVYGFALSILKNIHFAEDVLQDTYIRIYSSSSGYKSMKKPLAWILTITRNLCMMKLRDQQKIADLPPGEWNISTERFPAITVEDKLVLAACMEKLSDEERQIVMLHAVAGFKHREIADVLSLRLPTVLSKYNRAIKKLRVLLMEGEMK